MSETTLLVVEDHDILREGLQILLEAEGYQVVAAAAWPGSIGKNGKIHTRIDHVGYFHA